MANLRFINELIIPNICTSRLMIYPNNFSEFSILKINTIPDGHMFECLANRKHGFPFVFGCDKSIHSTKGTRNIWIIKKNKLLIATNYSYGDAFSKLSFYYEWNENLFVVERHVSVYMAGKLDIYQQFLLYMSTIYYTIVSHIVFYVKYNIHIKKVIQSEKQKIVFMCIYPTTVYTIIWELG